MNNYEKKKKLGQGSYGSAYLVEYKPTGQLYCMKKIKLSDMDSKEEREKAKQEVEILKMFNDSYIVSYFESFLDERQINLHIVMEYCAGGELESVIKKYKDDGNVMKENEILHYFYQICCGLLLIHSKKILHRDLKSNNVFLDGQNNCKIGDFGISKVLQCTAQKALTAIGTPYYLSPELCQGKPYDSKSDVWALGIILYELCSYNHPFNGNLMVIVMKICNCDFPDIPNGYSQELHDLVHLLMNKDPLQRPNCQEILNLPIMTKYMDSLQQELDKKIEKVPLNKHQSMRYLNHLKNYDFLSASSPNVLTRKTVGAKIDESKLSEFTAPSGKILPTLQEFDGIENSIEDSTVIMKDSVNIENVNGTMIVKDVNTLTANSIFHKEARKHQSVRIAEPVTKRPELPHHPSSFNNRNEMKTDAFGGTMYGLEDTKEDQDFGTMIIHDDGIEDSKTYTPVDEFRPNDTTDEFGILDETIEADMKNRIKLEALRRQLTRDIEFDLPPAEFGRIDTYTIKKRVIKKVGTEFYNKVSDYLKMHMDVSDATLVIEFGKEKLPEIKQIEQIIMFQQIQEEKKD